jgi:homoserine dehydrogenase
VFALWQTNPLSRAFQVCHYIKTSERAQSASSVNDSEVSPELLYHFLKALFYPQMAQITQIISFYLRYLRNLWMIITENKQKNTSVETSRMIEKICNIWITEYNKNMRDSQLKLS